MADKSQSLQDLFLNACRKDKQQVTVYLSNGVKLQGIVGGFDNFCVILRRTGQTQLVYKHSIATVVPMGGISMYSDETSSVGEQPDVGIESVDDGTFQIA